MPEAVDAASTAVTSASRSVTDIISMLVAIYGSKELLVNEYRALLAERLLAKDEYQTDREVRILELLNVH
jgi:anaphase-promoting complex subunit 2